MELEKEKLDWDESIGESSEQSEETQEVCALENANTSNIHTVDLDSTQQVRAN